MFTWVGCASAALEIPSPDEYPMIKLSDVTEDVIDAYYYLGLDKIGCMDKLALNYLESAVLDDESCIYSMNIGTGSGTQNKIKTYPQPAKTHVFIEFTGNQKDNNKDFVVYNIVGEVVYSGRVKKDRNVQINTEHWKPGSYYISIKMENRNLTHTSYGSGPFVDDVENFEKYVVKLCFSFQNKNLH